MTWLTTLWNSVHLFPTFADLEARTRRQAMALPRAEARARLAADPRLNHEAAVVFRDRLLALIDAPWTPATREQARDLVSQALAAQGFLARPGTIEDVWMIEGYLDRLSVP